MSEVRCSTNCGRWILWGPLATPEEVADGRCLLCIAAGKPRFDPVEHAIDHVRAWFATEWGQHPETVVRSGAGVMSWWLKRPPTLDELTRALQGISVVACATGPLTADEVARFVRCSPVPLIAEQRSAA